MIPVTSERRRKEEEEQLGRSMPLPPHAGDDGEKALRIGRPNQKKKK